MARNKSKRITKLQYDALWKDAYWLRQALENCLPLVSKLPCHIPNCGKCYLIDEAIKSAGGILNRTKSLAG